MKEVARNEWNVARDHPNNETFGDFLGNLKTTAKQAFGDEAERHIRTFLFDKLSVEINSNLPWPARKTARRKKSK